MSTVTYKRILLKLSGEAMEGEDNILDFDFVVFFFLFVVAIFFLFDCILYLYIIIE